MKIYRIPAGTYFEKQDDARKADREFEVVEFPFSASPKADFVDWLNGQIGPTFFESVQALGSVSTYEKAAQAVQEWAPPTAQPAPQQPALTTPQPVLFEDAFEAMPLATQLHYAALAVENARKVDFAGTTPAKAPQRYGRDA